MHGSILKRTFRYFLVSTCVIILVVTCLIFAYLRGQYQEQFTEAQFYVTQKTAESVNALHMDIRQSAYNLCCNEALAETLVSSASPIDQRQQLNRIIVMNAATPTATRLYSARQLLLVDEQFAFAHAPDARFTMDSFPEVHVYSSLGVKNEEWYQKARAYNAQIYAFRHPQAPDKVFFSHLLLSAHLTDPRYSSEAGVMLYVLPQASLNNLLRDEQMSEGSVSLLLFNNVLLGSTDESILPPGTVVTDDLLPLSQLTSSQQTVRAVVGSETYSVTSRYISNEWRVVLLTPSVNVWDSIKALLPVLGATLMVLAAIALAVSVMFSRRLSAPIMELSGAMVRDSDAHALPHRIPVPKTDDEIERLYHSYNDIVDNIHRISALEREHNAQLQKSELKALQSQINPHFIYNTLDSISCIALLNGVDDIATMVASLISILKYSIRFSHTWATLKEESDYLYQYIQIQKLRYSDRFRFEYDVPDSYSEVHVPRLMLQPLVENALFHAENADQLVIRVWCETDGDNFLIHVSDNGSGANAEQLNALLKTDPEAAGQKFGIGIRNVNKRIQLVAGEGYGIHYRLTETGGLDAVIRLPAADKIVKHS